MIYSSLSITIYSFYIDFSENANNRITEIKKAAQ